MAKRPNLPLETKVSIEREWIALHEHARRTFDLLYYRNNQGNVNPHGQVFTGVPQPATIQSQIQDFASNLFNAEAKHYIAYRASESIIRSWLIEIMPNIEEMIEREMSPYSLWHDSHCTPEERRASVRTGLEKMIDHWTNENAKRLIHRPVPQEPIEPVLGRHFWFPPPMEGSIIPAPPENPAEAQDIAKLMPGRIRLPGSIHSLAAASKMEVFLREKNILQKDFAKAVQCDERTLRRFRKTGTIRRDTLDAIAKEMNTTIEQLII